VRSQYHDAMRGESGGVTTEPAPLDDDPEPEEERRAAEEAKGELALGRGIPASAIERDFGV
jgi:hypothetical protein